jgi:diketogulonate reductase-like aldo/keto reductase
MMARATVTLRDGVSMPRLAFGTYKLAGDVCRDAVRDALVVGFRHIDTATCYRNERSVGEAVRASACAKEVFLTSKIAPNEMTSEETTSRAIDGVVDRLGRAPDLLLVHWPGEAKQAPTSERHREARERTWRVFERALEQGKTRSIGVSNFEIRHLEELLSYAKVKPSVNQIELHPRFNQRALREFCEMHGIHIQGYSPLGVGSLLEDARALEYAKKIGLAPAPALVRWTLTRDPECSVVVKSTAKTRTEENFTALRAKTAEASEDDIRAHADALEKAFESTQSKQCWDPSVVC